MKKLFSVLFLLTLILVVIYPFAIYFEYVLTEEQISITVMRTEKVVTEDLQNIYYIHTTKEVFINANNKFHKKDNAEQLIKKFKVGQTYKVNVVGYNFGIKLPFFFKERNIIDIVEEENILKRFQKY